MFCGAGKQKENERYVLKLVLTECSCHVFQGTEHMIPITIYVDFLGSYQPIPLLVMDIM